jgi:hypothetical protein
MIFSIKSSEVCSVVHNAADKDCVYLQVGTRSRLAHIVQSLDLASPIGEIARRRLTPIHRQHRSEKGQERSA